MLDNPAIDDVYETVIFRESGSKIFFDCSHYAPVRPAYANAPVFSEIDEPLICVMEKHFGCT